ncbi:hypothetical protein L6R50_06745 [Myxococcota bacterium]|nr:hypothetical protein [Myxococcota bacterium]
MPPSPLLTPLSMRVSGWRKLARGLVQRPFAPDREEAVEWRGPQGRLVGWLRTPGGTGPFPAVLLYPGGLGPARMFARYRCAVTAADLAAAGYASFRWDPAGRGESEGEEDCNGPRHQDEVAEALALLLARPEVDPARVAVVSISLGIAATAGALARHPGIGARARFLLDWEGPGERRWIPPYATRAPGQASITHEMHCRPEFWVDREAIRAVPRLPCPYLRYQSHWDHVHGPMRQHAVDLVNAALGGTAPWVRLNDNAPNVPVDGSALPLYRWAPPGLEETGRVIVSYLHELL